MGATPEKSQLLRNTLLRLDAGYLALVNGASFLLLQENLLNSQATLQILLNSGIANGAGIGFGPWILTNIGQKYGKRGETKNQQPSS